jgi:hypothetical protein
MNGRIGFLFLGTSRGGGGGEWAIAVFGALQHTELAGAKHVIAMG